MKKLKLYLETSVWNFLFAFDAQDKKTATELFFKEARTGKYDLFISQTVIAEINEAPNEKKEKLLRAIDEISPVILFRTKEVNNLAEAYIENGLLGKNHFLDVLHISYASINNLDILISWNMRHIVRTKTHFLVNLTNMARNIGNLEIWTPEELMDYED
jgi:hypothetical protein